VFNQWEFAICNTSFVVDEEQCLLNQLKRDGREYPEHLRYSWHLCRAPQEIYETTKKITNICKILNYNGNKPVISEPVIQQEADKCMDELFQQTLIWGNYSRTQIIALENYLSLSYKDSGSRLQGWWSVIPAIIIKRHSHLTLRYCAGPKIDDFCALVAQALHQRRNTEPSVMIEGSWEDTTGLYQGELQFIPTPPPPEPPVIENPGMFQLQVGHKTYWL